VKLISPGYLEENRRLHRLKQGYGGGGHKHAPDVVNFAAYLKAETILDYGCGEGTLKIALGKGNKKAEIEGFRWPGKVREYDPAVKGRLVAVESDLVVCTDVLEHIEPKLLTNVLQHISSLALKGVFMEIACRPSDKLLKDGRNAHLIVRPPKWWVKRLNTEGLKVFKWVPKARKEDNGPHSLRVWVIQ
jgi:2-polyprenyl-3-methyl-5-hydroxy-6-metoxy-1,4-benzoquinol methylase